MYDKRVQRVFCGSLMDIFEDAPGPNEWRTDVWKVIHDCPWLDFQLLTKRPENISKMLPDSWADNVWGYWPNVWLGTSIEDQRVAEREYVLTMTPAHIHFVSYEPAIGPLELTLQRIEWVIFGGESGPGFRPMKLEWARNMWDACKQSINPNRTAYFYKQSAAPRTEMGIDALGRVVREYPTSWDRRIPA
jgi:protein gp37